MSSAPVSEAEKESKINNSAQAKAGHNGAVVLGGDTTMPSRQVNGMSSKKVNEDGHDHDGHSTHSTGSGTSTITPAGSDYEDGYDDSSNRRLIGIAHNNGQAVTNHNSTANVSNSNKNVIVTHSVTAETEETETETETESKNAPPAHGGTGGGTPTPTVLTSSLTSTSSLGSVPRMPTVVVPYRDRANAIIETLTDSDKKILRLYEENAVIGGPFPVKLQIILKVTEILGQQHIISWLPHGRSFMIHRPREFEEKIMGEFFKQTKLSSFKRQLNLYDFQRVTRGTDCGSYYHEMFLRGKPLLAKRMVRRKIKGAKTSGAGVSSNSSVPGSPSVSTTISATANPISSANAGEEQDHVPDFYTMPFVGTNRSGLDLQQASRVMNSTRGAMNMNNMNGLAAGMGGAAAGMQGIGMNGAGMGNGMMNGGATGGMNPNHHHLSSAIGSLQSMSNHHHQGSIGSAGVGGGVGDHLNSYANRLQGGAGGAGLPGGLSNAHLGGSSGGAGASSHHLGGVGGAYDSLLAAASSMNSNTSALAGLSTQGSAHDLPLSPLQQLQHQQMKNELLQAGVGGGGHHPLQNHHHSSYPQQIQSTYAAAMENLNNSYALAANALRRDLDTASNMMTPEEMVAANHHLSRQAAGGGAAGLPNSYNFNGKGW